MEHRRVLRHAKKHFEYSTVERELLKGQSGTEPALRRGVCVCAELPWNVRVHLRGVSRNRRDSTHIYTVHFEAAIIVL